MDTSNIWWIASYPKSGNTWIRAFITAYFGNGKVDLNNLVGVQDVGTMWSHVVAYNALGKLSIFEQTALRPAMLLHLKASWPKGYRLWIKTHCANENTGGFEFVPRGLCDGVIYIIRDPRSIAPSLADHSGVSIDKAIESLNRENYCLKKEESYQWCGSWRQNVHSWLNADPEHNVSVFHYEDFFLEPRVTFEALVAAISGESADPEKLAQAIHSCSFGNLRALEEDAECFEECSQHSEFFFRRGSVDWTEELTPSQAQKIEEVNGDLMTELGYL